MAPTHSLPSTSSKEPSVHSFFEKVTGTWTYVVSSPSASKETMIIDTVLDFDPASGMISTASADIVLEFVKQEQLKVVYILETHAHADHLTASQYAAHSLSNNGVRPKIGIGSRITEVQKTFAGKYGLEAVREEEWEKMFDCLWKDDEVFKLGELEVKAVHLPGHTPDSMGYVIGSKVFTGDSIFLPDVGSARADFPNGSAHALYKSMFTLLSLDPNTSLFVGHDYPPAGTRGPTASSTVEEQKKENKHVKDGTTEEQFVKFREERDAQLAVPRLLHASMQVNIRGGRLPEKDGQGRRKFVIPLDVKGGEHWC
ncbi:Metallo-hydrolase/oxidoreductase [Atractiella rhizophila]|nr:Metallo-hydrolase/oxidoreductase [Atractiella rhizophila]